MSSSDTTAFSLSDNDSNNKIIINNNNGGGSNSNNDNVKPCCACPDTKKARDECIFKYGDETKCQNLIEAHRICGNEWSKSSM
ncbi:9743_t:CDS:2 [Entrophospora sp. SA101]|nr:9743_t:CDS:2 [Entrophospora sp. SA101]CAJ0850620.1 6055_t:CDS:2 [Entrophospora sp. SA101]CAJ0903693.1 11527_t:CDS:2 [Entrophospora sp. SA101]